MLGYIDGQDYIIVVNLVDEASAGRYRENLLRNPVADLRLCATPPDAAKRVKPIRHILNDEDACPWHRTWALAKEQKNAVYDS